MTVDIPSGLVRRALRAARKALASNPTVMRLLTAASAMLERNPGRLGNLAGEVGALIRMARESLRGTYRRVPRRTLVAVVGGLIYFLDPLDLIPDAIPVLGFLDDAVVLAWVISQVRRDLDLYLAWEREWGAAIDVEGSTSVGPDDLPRLGAGSPATSAR
jgi:uncharacterized membrane protein YkvA (DUF1232 family)